MNILKNLYYGDLEPIDKYFDKNSKYGAAFGIVADHEKKLMDFLASLPDAEEELNLFLQMQEAQMKISDFSECERFIDGFRMGAELMLETFIAPKQSVLRDIC